ncbi:MAG: hypothetical protein IJ009_04405 [Clostridia bacterium]|nr:hypothetical protein [Clostridia bacterium]
MNDEIYQNQQSEDTGVTINLREIMHVLWSRILWIVLVVAVCVAGTFIFTKVTEKPQYRSNATLFFVCDHANPATAIAVATYQAEDYAEMATTQDVLNTVINNLSLEMSYKTLASKITVEYGEESRIINLSVKDKYPNRAQTILDEICRVTKELSVDRSGAAASISVFGSAVEAEPVGSALTRNVLMAFLIGLVGSVGVIVAIHLFDDKIKSPDTVQRALGVSTLGTIPYQRAKEEEVLGGEG